MASPTAVLPAAKLSRTERPPARSSKSPAGLLEQGTRVCRRAAPPLELRPEVGPVVERPVGRCSITPAQADSVVQQQLPGPSELGDGLVALAVGLLREGRHGGILCGRRGTQRDVAGKRVDGAHEVLGQQHPAQTPARHAPVLAEGGDDDGRLVALPGADAAWVGGPGLGIGHPVVDLVADEAHAVVGAPAGDRSELGAVDHRPGRVGGRGDDEARERPVGLGGVEQSRGGLVARVRTAVDLDDLAAERGEDVAVGRVAGPGERDPVTGLEGREEGEDEPAGRTGRDRHSRRVDLEAVPPPVVRGELGAQLADAQRRRVRERSARGVDAGRRLGHEARRTARGLARAERHDVAPCCAQHGHPVEHVHDLEGRHLRAP